ncbi:hypothetical protein C0991_005607 [Blastosporella zonata]|nr:hypothetical protein C0991_005607 [Blastosporella zonata]
MDKVQSQPKGSQRRPSILPVALLIVFIVPFFLPGYTQYFDTSDDTLPKHPSSAATIVAHCRSLKAQAGPSVNFRKRAESDRFVPGTKPVLIQRARVWTGANNGTEVFHGDVLLDKGLIQNIGHLQGLVESFGKDLVVLDAKGAWVTPGIVDIHSHLGDAPSPALDGAEDDNSLHGTIQPWLRSVDGLNTHDDSYPLSIAGGVTTALILPGSSNAIGARHLK